jgi:hypothetical protein
MNSHGGNFSRHMIFIQSQTKWNNSRTKGFGGTQFAIFQFDFLSLRNFILKVVEEDQEFVISSDFIQNRRLFLMMVLFTWRKVILCKHMQKEMLGMHASIDEIKFWQC